MKKNSKYNKIGTLQLFKPDYLSENKKTLLTSNIIKEYLRKRKGKYYYKVNFIKNRFNIKIKENSDLINRKIEYKIIENGYKEMKSEINKRFNNYKTPENNKNNKFNINNYNCLSSRNDKRNNNLFPNINYSIKSDYKIYEKNFKFRKTYSEKKIKVLNNNNELNSIDINSRIKNTNYSINKNIEPISDKNIIGYQQNVTKKTDYKSDSHREGNKTEINYNSSYEFGEEMIKSKSNVNIQKKLSNFADTKFQEISYFSPMFDKEKQLRRKYNFFKIKEEGKLNLIKKKFMKVQKVLFSHDKAKPNGKFHLSYVKYFINTIKRREKVEKINQDKEKMKSHNGLSIKK